MWSVVLAAALFLAVCSSAELLCSIRLGISTPAEFQNCWIHPGSQAAISYGSHEQLQHLAGQKGTTSTSVWCKQWLICIESETHKSPLSLEETAAKRSNSSSSCFRSPDQPPQMLLTMAGQIGQSSSSSSAKWAISASSTIQKLLFNIFPKSSARSNFLPST